MHDPMKRLLQKMRNEPPALRRRSFERAQRDVRDSEDRRRKAGGSSYKCASLLDFSDSRTPSFFLTALRWNDRFYRK